MVTIANLQAVEILDSRGNPTIETFIELSDGNKTKAAIPSGASVGKYESIELRDNDPKRYNGMGVLKAVNNVNNIIKPKLIGIDIVKQGYIDSLMIQLDGTNNKSNLGSNAILSVSIAVCKAAAMAVKTPLYKYISFLINSGQKNEINKLPIPTFNIINGGKHGGNNLDIQEFHIIPASNKPYHISLQIGEEIYQSLKNILLTKNSTVSIGDEGGFTPNLSTNADALETILEAIKNSNYKFGFDVFLGLDVAASSIFKDDYYHIKDLPTSLNSNDFSKFLIDLNKNYGLLTLEDPLNEDDWEGWKKLNEEIGQETLIIGDDLLVTNPDRLKKAISEKACWGILIKPNQIGTISETLNVINIAKSGKFKIIVSHRSGETNDTFIADLAVGVNADYAKFGAPARGERVAKYNRLLEIETELKLI